MPEGHQQKGSNHMKDTAAGQEDEGMMDRNSCLIKQLKTKTFHTFINTIKLFPLE